MDTTDKAEPCPELCRLALWVQKFKAVGGIPGRPLFADPKDKSAATLTAIESVGRLDGSVRSGCRGRATFGSPTSRPALASCQKSMRFLMTNQI